MKIYIPTRGRPDKQVTARLLMEAGFDPILVVANDDSSDYSAWEDSVLRVDAKNIGEKRQKILEQAPDKFVMMDDDLRFRRRLPNNKFVNSSDEDIRLMIWDLNKYLDSYAQVGIMDEFMSQHSPRGGRTGGRYNQVLGYNKALFPDPYPSFRLVINEEHDFHLQLATKGFPAYVLTEYTKGSKYYAKGGLSGYRTSEFENEQHSKLEELWPGIVKKLESKSSLSGYRVAINWKRAYGHHHTNVSENGQSAHLQATS